jgi:hypothetical protein
LILFNRAAKEIWGVDETSSLKNYVGIDISQPQLDITAELFNRKLFHKS